MPEALQTLVEEYRRWKRRNPDFPLVVHPKGLWSKKIRGKVHYFGPLANPDRALRLWLKEKDYLIAGEKPPSEVAGLTVGELCDLFKADSKQRSESGEIGRPFYLEMRFACKFLKGQLGHYIAAQLHPTHFTKLRQAVTETKRNLRSQGNLIGNIRAIFRWGAAMQYLPSQPPYGPRFKSPSADAVAKEYELSGKCRFIDREDLLRLIENASPSMKVILLLGINCGFYAGDTIAIPLRRLHLDGPVPFHDFPRAKNGRRRKAVLWPETVEAIREYIERHRGDCPAPNLLISRNGEPYERGATCGTLKDIFTTLCEQSEVSLSKGTNIGSLRHTYGTVVDLSPDQKMINLTMGHTDKSLQKRVYSQLNLNELNRLKAVADVVHRWLYEGDCGNFGD